MNKQEYPSRVRQILRTAGLRRAHLQGEQYGESFGDALLLFKLGNLLLRVVRDRGQEFLDIGSVAVPERFCSIDVFEIAMGWRTVEQVISRSEPEPLVDVLARVAEHLGESQLALSPEREPHTRAMMTRAEEWIKEAHAARYRELLGAGGPQEPCR